MITTVKPYVILLNWIDGNHDLKEMVGTNIWYGGVPIDFQATMPVKAVNIFTVGGTPDVSLPLIRPEFQIECYGADLGEAWDVYRALVGTIEDVQRTWNRMVATPEGETYMFALQEMSPGVDYIDPGNNWTSVVSRWRMTAWKQTK